MPTAQERADQYLEKATLAAAEFSQMDQAQTDRIVEAVFRAGFKARVHLARMAAEETGLGVWQHKVVKNVLASQLVYEEIRHVKTVGVLSDDPLTGIVEIAQPLGPIFAIIPVTNPTSTILFKTLICLKSRNPIIISPPSRAATCGQEAARICYEAALEAGAPEDCIQVVTARSPETSKLLMSHKKLALILATGGTGMVTAAYSSGTPAIGVGPGNVPVLVDVSADLAYAVRSILSSKTFDNGTICASEQAIVVEKSHAPALRAEFERQGAHFLTPAEVEAVERVAINPETMGMSPFIVGQSVETIALKAGITVPAGTRVLMAPLDGVGDDHPLSGEVLAPILAWYVADSYDEAAKLCIDLNYRGGIGHTAAIYANDEKRIREYAELMNAGRVVVNTPSAQGAVGGLFNTISVSLTLGCGSGGRNITTENITARHLINIKRVCRPRPNDKWFRFDTERFLDDGLDPDALLDDYYRNA